MKIGDDAVDHTVVIARRNDHTCRRYEPVAYAAEQRSERFGHRQTRMRRIVRIPLRKFVYVKPLIGTTPEMIDTFQRAHRCSAHSYDRTRAARQLLDQTTAHRNELAVHHMLPDVVGLDRLKRACAHM